MQSYGIYDESRNSYKLGQCAETSEGRPIFVNRHRTVYDTELGDVQCCGQNNNDKEMNDKVRGEKVVRQGDTGDNLTMTHALTRKDLATARRNFFAERGSYPLSSYLSI